MPVDVEETRMLFEWFYLVVLTGTLTQPSSLFSFVSAPSPAKFSSRMLSKFLLRIRSAINSKSES